jgi:hypothetical protein
MIPKKSFTWIWVILWLISTGFAGWFYYQILQLKPQPNQPNAPITTASPQPSPIKDQGISWATAKYANLFSYEYPAGWHVAELWQENYAENGIIIAIDPKPISTAPRGGPLATFEITLLSGNQNPDEILQKRMENFNSDNYYEINKETIQADIGTVFYRQGKIAGEMMKGASVESYFFTFHKNPNDLINQQVVIANLIFNDDPKLSEMLRHIVLSFKELQQ